MAYVSVKFDSNADISLAYQGKYFSKSSYLPSMDEIKKAHPLTGKVLETLKKYFFPEVEDWTPLLITSKQGAFDRLYGPVVCTDGESLILSAGMVNTPLNLNNKGEILGLPEGLEGELQIVSEEFNGYPNNLVAALTLTRGDTILVYQFSLKTRKLKDGEKLPNATELNNYLKRDTYALLHWLGNPPSKSTKLIAAKQLPPDEYKVVGYVNRQTKDGRPMSILNIQGEMSEEGLYTQEYIDPDDESRETYVPLEEVGVFAPKEILALLELEPGISPEYPATLQIRSVVPGKKAGTFRVDLGFIMSPDTPMPEPEDEDLSLLDI